MQASARRRISPAAWQCLAALAAAGSLAAADDRGVTAPVDLDARRQRVLKMSADRFEEVLRSRDRLAEMPPEQQDKLRRLAHDLEQSPDGEQLRRVMLRYHDWVRNLNLSQRSEILELPPEQRLAKIKTLRAKQRARAQAETADGGPLTPADKMHILSWIDGYALKIQENLLADLPPEKREEIDRMDPFKRRWSLRILLMQRSHAGRPPGSQRALPTAAEIDALIAKLSPAAQTTIRQRGGLLQQWILLCQWSQAVVRGRMMETGAGRAMPAIAVDELQRFFETNLPPQKREELLNLPPEETQREVRRLFFLQSRHADSAPQPHAEPPANPRAGDANDKKPAGASDAKPTKSHRPFERPRGRATDAGANGNTPPGQ